LPLFQLYDQLVDFINEHAHEYQLLNEKQATQFVDLFVANKHVSSVIAGATISNQQVEGLRFPADENFPNGVVFLQLVLNNNLNAYVYASVDGISGEPLSFGTALTDDEGNISFNID